MERRPRPASPHISRLGYAIPFAFLSCRMEEEFRWWPNSTIGIKIFLDRLFLFLLYVTFGSWPKMPASNSRSFFFNLLLFFYVPDQAECSDTVVWSAGRISLGLMIPTRRLMVCCRGVNWWFLDAHSIFFVSSKFCTTFVNWEVVQNFELKRIGGTSKYHQLTSLVRWTTKTFTAIGNPLLGNGISEQWLSSVLSHHLCWLTTWLKLVAKRKRAETVSEGIPFHGGSVPASPGGGGQPVFDTPYVMSKPQRWLVVHATLRNVSYFVPFQTMVSVKIVKWKPSFFKLWSCFLCTEAILYM